MSAQTIQISPHARLRMAQRNVSDAQVSFILTHGHAVHCAGAILVTLRQKDIPKSERAKDTFACLEGVTVVMNRSAPVVQTVWRNRRHGLRHIRQKPRYSC
ncbi:MAG: DUF4258 domain-containing protein [Chloroflexi bacterium]|nr:DUF4258 domain-containing protein [Chloroflexota bacterium]